MDPLIRSAVLLEQPRTLLRRRLAPQAGIAYPAAPAPAPAPVAADADASALAPILADERAALEAERSALAFRAEAELERLRSAAHEQGYAEGLRQGQQEASEMMASLSERMVLVLSQLSRLRQDLAAQAEDDIVAIAFAAVCRILGERAAKVEGVRALVAESLGLVRDSGPLVLGLHPDDLQVLRSHAAGELPERVELTADHGVELGGCRIESALGTLDARLETQLDALRAALTEARLVRADCGDEV